ncbi:hypothetical protein EDB19DRAFT_1831326 [Suillus lakei]|nr:hypothetical protein EDB19DRAFT_1831326 [Suillus lakei]
MYEAYGKLINQTSTTGEMHNQKLESGENLYGDIQKEKENRDEMEMSNGDGIGGMTSSIPQKMKKMKEVLSSTSNDSTHPPHKRSRMVYNESDAMDTQQSPSATSVVIDSEVDSQNGHMESLQLMFLSKLSLQLPTQSQLKAVMEAQGNI